MIDTKSGASVSLENNIYDMNILNDINYKNDDKVNNIAELYLLHGIINDFRHTKIQIDIIHQFYMYVWIYVGS